jgi:hypothetical protein
MAPSGLAVHTSATCVDRKQVTAPARARRDGHIAPSRTVARSPCFGKGRGTLVPATGALAFAASRLGSSTGALPCALPPSDRFAWDS